MEREFTKWEKKANEDFPGLNADKYFWCEEGWHSLIYTMLEEIWHLGIRSGIGNIKQKYGDLEVYFDGQLVNQIIEDAKNLAEDTCERCGYVSEECLLTDTGGWEMRLCARCRGEKPSSVIKDSVDCFWEFNTDGYWKTGCGKAFSFENCDGLVENNYHFCPNCGKPVEAE